MAPAATAHPFHGLALVGPSVNAHGIEQQPCLFPLFAACRSMRDMVKIHALVVKLGQANDISVTSRMVSFCAVSNSGSLEYARLLFRQLDRPDSFLWNTLIRGHARSDDPNDALLLLHEMVSQGTVPLDKFTFPFAFKACSRLRAIEEGKQLHTHVFKSGFASDPIVQNAIINMYGQSGHLYSAHQVFDRNPQPDAVSWNSLIGGYTRCGFLEGAHSLFSQMPHKTAFSWNLMVSGYTKSGQPELAKSLFHSKPKNISSNSINDNHGSNSDEVLISLSCLMTAHVETGEMKAARQLFDEMPERDVVCWSAMISGYTRSGHYKDALSIFKDMQVAKVEPDRVTMVSLLSACSHLGAVDQGKWVHAFILRKKKMKLDGSLACAIIDMYSKCGSMNDAFHVFDEMPVKDLFAWNSMICGLAINGYGKRMMGYFREMVMSGLKPDGVTFVGLLTGCSHAGLLEEGRRCFELMTTTYGIEPDIKHYGCMVDLLGRAGLVKEAEELVENMPVKPNVETWGALLGACRRQGNVEMAERAAEALIELQPDHSSCLVLLSNIYAAAGRWGDVRAVRERMKKNKRGLKRVPGCSLIQVRGNVTEFVVGDVSHPQAKEMYSMLGDISQQLRRVGYIPDTSEALFDVSEDEKEAALGYHSEKLALAFGLINTAPGETILIVKNLRVCGDCHSTFKLVSRIYGRDINLRDRNRFHLFRQGSCSCADYW